MSVSTQQPSPTREASADKPSALRQFIKFCLVGGTSTVLDLAIYALVLAQLERLLPLGAWGLGETEIASARAGLASVAGTSLGVINSYVWNSLWTFRGQGTAGPGRFLRFVMVNVVGLLLSAGLTTAGVYGLHHLGLDVITPLGAAGPHIKAAFVAKLAAVGIVVFWNFAANRRWTYA